MEITEWQRLTKLSSPGNPLLGLGCINCQVRIEGAANECGPVTWIRASTAVDGEPATKVALKLRTQDWYWVQQATGTLKVLQAKCFNADTTPVLDVTDVASTIVAILPMENHTTIAVAELFCGGFSGWAQACYVLHRHKLPLHMSWKLDNDEEVIPYLQTQQPNLHVIGPDDEFELPENSCIHLKADVNDSWWHRILAARYPMLIAVSAPCPAWSTAGFQRRLTSPEGQLLLRSADVCGAAEIPYVVLEQVEGFMKHADYSFVISAWATAGYVVAWQATLDLLDLLPTSRRRFLAVLIHRRVAQRPMVPAVAWTKHRRPTLASAFAIFTHPPDVLKPLILSNEVLDRYLDPELVPCRPGYARSPLPQSYRLRTPEGVASCFLARYTQQHELPAKLLRDKGLFGCLLRDGSRVRFFSQAEVASLHGAVSPQLITRQLSCDMRILGNCIAVPHAIAAISHALQLMQVPGAMDKADAVQVCLANRLHAQNTSFVPSPEGWVLCTHEQLPGVLLQLSARPPRDLIPRLSQLFVTVQLCTDTQAHSLQTSAMLTSQDVCLHLGVEMRIPPPQQHVSTVCSVQALPTLLDIGWHGIRPDTDKCTSILAESGHFVVERAMTLAWPQIAAVAAAACPNPKDSLALFSMSGCRQETADRLPAVVLAAAEGTDDLLLDLQLSTADTAQLNLIVQDALIELCVPASLTTLLRLTFPRHLLLPLGWDWVVLLGTMDQPQVRLQIRAVADFCMSALRFPGTLAIEDPAWRLRFTWKHIRPGKASCQHRFRC